MGLIVSITLVLGLIFYWEGRRLYKEPEENTNYQLGIWDKSLKNIRNYKELQSR